MLYLVTPPTISYFEAYDKMRPPVLEFEEIHTFLNAQTDSKMHDTFLSSFIWSKN